MDRVKAKSMTRTVQTVAIVLVAATAAAAMVPLGVKAEPITAGPAQPSPASKPVEASKVEVDTANAALFLNAVSGPVKNQAPDKPIDEPPPVPVLTGVDSWRYLGGIISSSYKRAVVVIDDQQHLFAEGQKYNPDAAHNPDGGYEIVQIDRAFVKVKEGETEHVISIAARQKPVLTVLENTPGGAGGRGGNQPAVAGYANPAAGMARGATALGDGGMASTRLRQLERQKADAKARGDNAAAMGLESAINDATKEAKFEKGEKGQK